MLRDWLGRAGLTLATQRTFARENAVVVAQHGVWRDVETEHIKGEADLASSFRVSQGRVIRYARFDDVASALNDVGLIGEDEVDAK